MCSILSTLTLVSQRSVKVNFGTKCWPLTPVPRPDILSWSKMSSKIFIQMHHGFITWNLLSLCPFPRNRTISFSFQKLIFVATSLADPVVWLNCHPFKSNTSISKVKVVIAGLVELSAWVPKVRSHRILAFCASSIVENFLSTVFVKPLNSFFSAPWSAVATKN